MILTLLNTMCIFLSSYCAYRAIQCNMHWVVVAINIFSAVLNLMIVLSRTGVIG